MTEASTVSILVPQDIVLTHQGTGELLKGRDPETGKLSDLKPFSWREVALGQWAVSPAAGIDNMVKLHDWQDFIGAVKTAKPGAPCVMSKDAHALLCPVVEAWILALAKDDPSAAQQLLPIVDAVLKAS